MGEEVLFLKNKIKFLSKFIFSHSLIDFIHFTFSHTRTKSLNWFGALVCDTELGQEMLPIKFSVSPFVLS